jgi:disulfide bond formation protein DsbB
VTADTRPYSKLALWLGAVAAVLIVASFPLSALAHQLTFGGIGQLLLMIPFAAVGALVASREPRNPIGWLLLAIAVTASYGADAGFYAVRAYHIDHHGLPLSRLAVFLTQGWASMLVLLPLPILFFPDGKISRPWRWTLGAYIALVAVLVSHLAITDFAAFTEQTVRIDSSGELKQLGASSGGVDVGFALVVFPFFAISLSWVVRQVVLYRRSSGDGRQQRKWLLAGGSFAVSGFFLAITVGSSGNGFLSAIGKVGFLGLIALPISIGIGILRYRLYDIDRLISRTLSYALLTGLLVGVFAGVVLLTTRVLPFSSPVGVAASTLAAAGLFSPLRSRLQRLVDRRFNRARYDAEATVAAFGASLRDAVDVETVLDELAATAGRSLEPAHVTVWIRS